MSATEPLGEYVILCEGKSDAAFFRHLQEKRAIAPRYTPVFPRGDTEGMGSGGFRRRLQALKLQAGFDGVKGIIVAADNEGQPKVHFKLARNAIKKAGGYCVPTSPYVIAPRNANAPHIVVMMIPDTDEKGAIESLCLEAMYSAHPETAGCVKALAECVGANNWNLHTRSLKMKLRVMLSSLCEEDPNTGLTHAWSKKGIELIPLDHPIFDKIALYLTEFPAKLAAL